MLFVVTTAYCKRIDSTPGRMICTIAYFVVVMMVSLVNCDLPKLTL